jgi:hypothetical protein
MLAAMQRSAGNAAVARLLRAVAPPGADVAAGATDMAGASGLLVEDDADPSDRQLRRGEFLDRVLISVCAVAERELPDLYRAAGCPWIEHWVSYYRTRPASEVAAAVVRYAPAAASAARAAEWVDHICARVESGIRAWRATGELPEVPVGSPGVPPGEPQPGATAAGTVARSATPGPLGLGAGQPLDSTVRARMEPLLGSDLGGVRVHRDAPVVRAERAQALAIGRHVAFAPGRYEPGTPIGDALIAHELAHVIQQTGAGAPGEAALEQDATRSAGFAAAALWTDVPQIARLARARAAPALRSGLALQRCGDDPPADPRIWVPTSTRAAGGGAGAAPTVNTSGGRADVRFDGDGDQVHELAAEIATTATWPDGAASDVHLDLRQLSSGTGRAADFQLPATTDGGGRAAVSVRDVTDGRHPTEIGLVAEPGSQKLLIHPPRRGPAAITHDVELTGEPALSSGNQLRSLTFPPETTPGRAVFSPDDPNRPADAPPGPTAPRDVGGIWTYDVTVGSYGDFFRITVRKPDPTVAAAALGVSVLSDGQPVAGYQADLRVTGALRVALVQADPAALALDLDGDGQTDVSLFDRLSQAPSGGSMERDRDHRITVSGPAAQREQTFSFPVRDGQIAAGSRPGDPANEQAASQARAVSGLESQAAIADVDAELAQIDQFLISMRQLARDENLISPGLFSAWEQLSRDFIVIGALGARGEIGSEQRREIMTHAGEFHARLATETESAVRWEGSADMDDLGERGHNPYTGGTLIRGGGMTIHEAPTLWLMAIRDGNWAEAIGQYSRFVRGMDRWIAKRNRDRHGSYVDARRPETARASAIEQLTGMRPNLAGIQGRNRTRVSAVLHTSEGYEDTGRIAEVPLSMYYWRDGANWALQDFSRVDETPVWHIPAEEGQNEPPRELFVRLNDNDHFPRGTVHYRLPSGTGAQVPTTGPSALRQFLTYGSMVAAGVGLAMLAGPAGVAVVGGYILAASSLVGAGLAVHDLIDRYRHDNLTAGSIVINLTDIVSAATGLGALRAGRILVGARIAAAAGEAQPMRWGIRWADRWFLRLERANQVTDMITLAVMASQLEASFQQLQQMPAGPEKDRALRSFFLQAALTGGIGALQIRGLVPDIRPGRHVRVEMVNGIEYAVPEGASAQGRAINESRSRLDDGPPSEAGARRADHLRGIQGAIGGEGGRALAEIEELALAGARGDVTVGGDGGLLRGGRASGTLDELVQRLLRANSEAAAHGVETQYSLQLGAPGADGRRPVTIVDEPRGKSDPAVVMAQYLGGTTGRRTDVGEMVEALRAADPASSVEVLPDGKLRLNDEIGIEAARLAEMRAADADNLRKLLVGTRLLHAEGGVLDDLRRSGAGAQAAGWLEGFASSGNFRLRFDYHQDLGTERALTGFGLEGDDLAKMTKLMTEAKPHERTRMYDLYNEDRGESNMPNRRLYARTALARDPGDVLEFVNRYQFAQADMARRIAEVGRMRAERLRRAQAANETVPVSPRRGGGTRPFGLNDAEADVIASEARRLGLTTTPRNINELVRAEFESPIGRAESATREQAAIEEASSRVGPTMLDAGAAAAATPASLEARLRDAARNQQRIQFGEATGGAYHVLKHHKALPPDEAYDAANPRTGIEGQHDAMLESARLTIEHGRVVRTEALQEQIGWKLHFERTTEYPREGPDRTTYRLRAIVLVKFDGSAQLLTYGGTGGR